MSELSILNAGAKYTHGNVGSLADFEGKIFTKEQIGETSCEISFGTLAPGQAVPFFHSHKADEENYIILSGNGLFQVDGDVFPIKEGSIVRVATGSDRNLKNTDADRNLVYICIQAKEGSLDQYTMTDAVITERVSKL